MLLCTYCMCLRQSYDKNSIDSSVKACKFANVCPLRRRIPQMYQSSVVPSRNVCSLHGSFPRAETIALLKTDLFVVQDTCDFCLCPNSGAGSSEVCISRPNTSEHVKKSVPNHMFKRNAASFFFFFLSPNLDDTRSPQYPMIH